MQQAPFEHPIASQMYNFLPAFNTNQNVIPRTVECLTMLYPDPEAYATRSFYSKINIIFLSDMPMTSHTWNKMYEFFSSFLINHDLITPTGLVSGEE